MLRADMDRSVVSVKEIRSEILVHMVREDSRTAVSQKRISICVPLPTTYAAGITERLSMCWAG